MSCTKKKKSITLSWDMLQKLKGKSGVSVLICTLKGPIHFLSINLLMAQDLRNNLFQFKRIQNQASSHRRISICLCRAIATGIQNMLNSFHGIFFLTHSKFLNCLTKNVVKTLHKLPQGISTLQWECEKKFLSNFAQVICGYSAHCWQKALL